jgi:outer membrane beta-barrel protein
MAALSTLLCTTAAAEAAPVLTATAPPARATAQVGSAPASATAAVPVTGGVTSACVDQAIADRLSLKRKRRGSVDRLFIKQSRHELAATGGYYQSDLFSGTYMVGGSYTYHMTESTAVEFGAVWTHANADVIRAIEDSRGRVIEETFDRILIAESLLILTPVYGKMRLGGSIVHFDLHLDLGVGVVDSQTSRGAMGVAGAGIKMFAGRAVAFRLDARNRTYRQELLDERFLVNDLAVTFGLSLLLPFRN